MGDDRRSLAADPLRGARSDRRRGGAKGTWNPSEGAEASSTLRAGFETGTPRWGRV